MIHRGASEFSFPCKPLGDQANIGNIDNNWGLGIAMGVKRVIEVHGEVELLFPQAKTGGEYKIYASCLPELVRFSA